MKKLIIITLLLSGCAQAPYVNPYLDGKHSVSAGNTSEATYPVKCKDQSDCSLKWQKAQLWVLNNGVWKIQISNDTLIQTFGPGSTTDTAYAVTRQNNPDGSGLIDIKAACGNIFACYPNPKRQEQAFRSHLN
jgi:hypothetical protein